MTGFPGAAGRTGPPGPSVSKSSNYVLYSSQTALFLVGNWQETLWKPVTNILLLLSWSEISFPEPLRQNHHKLYFIRSP